MRKTLFVLFVMMGSLAFAESDSYILRAHETFDTLAVFHTIEGSPLYLQAEVTLPAEVNRVEITQRMSDVVTAWYGPSWDGYSSSLSDDEGYCWWTCPDLSETKCVKTGIASGSGLQNHIGIIIPKGSYRITFDSRVGHDYCFMIELLSPSALPTDKQTSHAVKRLVGGQVVIFRNGKMYNLLGAELK